MSLETIWHGYHASLKAFLHKHVSNSADVDDLLQDILLKSHQNLSKLQDQKKLKSWLFQIAHNSIVDFYRDKGKRNSLEDDDLWYQQDDKDLYQQMTRCVLPFIQGLPREQAELLTDIEINGISQKDYAERHGIKYSTLKSRVSKSRHDLFALFNQCCEFSLDKQGNLSDFDLKKSQCQKC